MYFKPMWPQPHSIGFILKSGVKKLEGFFKGFYLLLEEVNVSSQIIWCRLEDGVSLNPTGLSKFIYILPFLILNYVFHAAAVSAWGN